MRSHKMQETVKILDYWFVMEFLAQDSYEMSTNAAENKRKLKIYRKNLADKKKDERKQITAFIELQKGQSIYDRVKAECSACRMGTWGNITVYLGKLKREICIERIAEYLNLHLEDRPEKSYDDIAVASFQMDANGRYIPRSFSLSSIVWAVKQLKGKKNEMLSNVLSVNGYQEAVSGIENTFWNPFEERDEEDAQYKAFGNQPPVFAEESVSMETLEKVYEWIRNTYMSSLDGEEIYGISVQFFQDQKSKERYENDGYLGLSHSYFAQDLKMLKDLIENGELESEKEMGRYLIDYIHVPQSEEVARERRRDLLHMEAEELELWLLEVLNLKHAPLGKWPSRYMPALMQQVAVNFAAEKEKEGIFGENGPVFSVNGPPGTGKTTLLKEIIANHIIEKARRLAVYEDPDDAFEPHKFLRGEKREGRYSKFVGAWYSLKDERIHDYHLLVASCNNAAVENITKELPLESGILGSLRSADGDKEKMKFQLGEVEALFSVEKSTQTERLFRGKDSREGDYSEIYFTEYAKNLLGREDVWGLAAAPLGKKSNLSAFYYQVLEPLCRDFYPNGQFKERRKEKYAKAREKFEEQLKKVKEIQGRLAVLGDTAWKVKQAEKQSRENRARGMALIHAEQKRLDTLLAEGKRLEGEHEQITGKLREEQEKYVKTQEVRDSWREKYNLQKQERIAAQERAVETMNGVGLLTKLFLKKKYQDAENLAQTYGRKAEEIQEEMERSEKQIADLESVLQKGEGQITRMETEAEQKLRRWKEVEKQRKEACDLIKAAKEKIESEAGTLEKLRRHWNEEAKKFQEKEDVQRGGVLDDAFVSRVFSSDAEVSADAQTMNPWTTDYYNREREKLLYHALQLTKEFILNSKSCRDNFTTLGQYWGFRMGDDRERILFQKEDREAMTGPLYQTLFLLVPVISSTFASFGTLFKDVKTPGVIGTLVIDEAGQAQPQMAVGALYRSRRAVIVGDPRQVEPVVTDDLELLKRSYQEDMYRFYQDKSLSVQRCADMLNPFGTYLENGTDAPEWIGSPLLVHRRCISPMYEISNRISYGGMMKQRTLPPGEEKQKTFSCQSSRWINVSGVENGRKDHFVKEQGERACEILERAFQKSAFPSLYIISPFKSVIYGIRKYIQEYCGRNRESYLNQSAEKEKWIRENIGTVHTFQGKEADEVLFLLGCDTGKDAVGAIRWVSSNIVNVAVTRAKYRLCVIGDIKAWEANPFVNEMKVVLDTFALKEIAAIQESSLSEEEKERCLRAAAAQIPSGDSFPRKEELDENGESVYLVDTDSFINSLRKERVLQELLSEKQLQAFGFKNQEEFQRLPKPIQGNLLFGIKLYGALKPLFEAEGALDASCCAILFCKALELQVQNHFADGLKKRFPEHMLYASGGRRLKMKDAQKQDLMLGTIRFLLKQYAEEIVRFMQEQGEDSLNDAWWKTFREELDFCAKKRNRCCHPQWFQWKDMQELIQAGFCSRRDALEHRGQRGVFFASEAGRKLG